MSHTTRIDIEGYGDVRVHHNSDWSGDVTIIYEERGQTHSVELPGAVLISLGRETALDQIRSQVMRVLEGGPPGVRRPSFNHTRADGLYDPCPECLDLMSAPDLRKLVTDLRHQLSNREPQTT